MRQKHPRDISRSAGFTLIEVGIVVPILIVTVLILFDALFAMIRTSTVERGQIDTTYDSQSALANLESDVVLASLFLPAVDSTLTTDPYPPSSNGGVWSYKGDSGNARTLIVRLYSTTVNPLRSDRSPVFIGTPATTACDSSHIYLNEVQHYDAIYFVKNNTLFRRRIIDKTTDLCVGQYQKFSCPSQDDLTAQGLGTRNATCQADDEIIARDVSDFSIDYYETKLSTTPLDVYASDADPDLVTAAADAEISVTISRKVSGKTVTYTSKLRLSKLNAKIGTAE